MVYTSGGYRGEILTRDRINNFIPNVWMGDIRYYRDSSFFMKDLTLSKSFVGKKGDTIKIPLVGRANVYDRIPGQPVQFQSRTPGQYEMTVDQDKESSFAIDDIVDIQSQYELTQPYTKEAGYAMMRDLNNALLALRAAIPTASRLFRTSDGTAAGTPAALDQATITAAMQLFAERNIPLSECAWVFSPQQFFDLLVLEIIQNADYSIAGNFSPTGHDMNSGRCGTLYNIPVYMSSEIGNNTLDGYIPAEGEAGQPTPGVAGSPYLPTQDTVIGGGLNRGQTGSEVANPFQTGMLVHPEWCMLGYQENIKVESDRLVQYQTDLLVTRHVYGCKVYRDDHAVLLFSQGT